MPKLRTLPLLWLLLLAGLTAAGCVKVGADFVRPPADVRSGWLEEDADRTRPLPVDDHLWWTAFRDPALDRLILGVVPLALANGAGAASRQALGTAVIGGMLASTLIAILFVPVYYVLMVRLSRWIGGRKKAAARPAEATAATKET